MNTVTDKKPRLTTSAMIAFMAAEGQRVLAAPFGKARVIPGLRVVDPCDALDIEQAVPQVAAHQGPVCMRLLRRNVPLAGALPTLHDRYGISAEKMAASLKAWLK